MTKTLMVLIVVLQSPTVFALGQSEQEYIDFIVSKYQLTMEIALEKSFRYAPAEGRSFYYGGEVLTYSFEGEEETVPFPSELDPEGILGAGPQYYFPETGRLYCWIGFRNNEEFAESLFYLYDTRNQVWNNIPYVDEKDVFRLIVLSNEEIVFIPYEENVLIVYDMKTESEANFSYGREGDFFPFMLGAELYAFGENLVGLRKARFEPDGKTTFIIFDVESQQFIEYKLPPGVFRDFVFLERRTFYCIEDYDFFGGALRKSRIVKIDLEANEVEVVALDAFDREMYDFKRLDGNLYSFVVDTGKPGASSGRTGGHMVLFTIQLAE